MRRLWNLEVVCSFNSQNLHVSNSPTSTLAPSKQINSHWNLRLYLCPCFEIVSVLTQLFISQLVPLKSHAVVTTWKLWFGSFWKWIFGLWFTDRLLSWLVLLLLLWICDISPTLNVLSEALNQNSHVHPGDKGTLVFCWVLMAVCLLLSVHAGLG